MYKPDQLVATAFSMVQTARASKATLPQRLLFPQTDRNSIIWGRDGSGKEVTPTFLANSLTEARIRPHSRRRDDDFMYFYLKDSKMLGEGSSMDKVFIPKSVVKEKFMLNKVPSLDYLVGDSKREDSWNVTKKHGLEFLFAEFQRNRGIGKEMLVSCEVREIIAGRTPGEEVVEIKAWMMAKYRESEDRHSTGVVSFDIEEVPMRRTEYDNFLAGRFEGDVFSFNTKVGGYKCGQLPVKVMIGDGYKWAVMITILVSAAKDGMSTVDRLKLQPELVELLRELPVVTGVGVRSDLMALEDLVRQVTGDNLFAMKGFLDLGVLAVVAGYNLPFFFMAILSTQLLGGSLNKVVSVGDGTWGLSWKKISPSLQVYCLADLKFGFQTVTVLLAMLLRDMFPDPDVVLSFCRSSGHAFNEWFTSWLVEILKNCEVDSEALNCASTREDLIHTIRYRVGKKRSSQAPERVSVICRLLGYWPSLSFGGCRFLHQARRKFLEQVQVLKETEAFGFDTIMPYEVTDEMREFATYALSGLADLDYTLPIRVALGFTIHPDIELSTVCHIPAACLGSAEIFFVAEKKKRIRREMCYEWARMNLATLDGFFKKLAKDDHFRKWIRTYYSELRMIYLRCTGNPAPRVKKLDHHIYSKADEGLLKVQERLARMKVVMDAYRKRAAFYSLTKMEAKPSDAGEERLVPNLSWRGQLTPIPGMRVKRKKGAVKGSRVDFAPEDYNKERDVASDRKRLKVTARREPGENSTGGWQSGSSRKVFHTQDEYEEDVDLDLNASNDLEMFQPDFDVLDTPDSPNMQTAD